MASRGQIAAGTDGTDFSHRQRVATHYQQSVVNKARLKFTIYMHYMIFALMLVKLADDILDRLDVFILELQELYIPKPRLWEWVWCGSAIASLFGLHAIRRNGSYAIVLFGVGILNVGLAPCLYAATLHFTDFVTYIQTRDVGALSQVWRGLPVAVLWYIFLTVALQVHAAQIFFAYQLHKSWQRKRKSN